jgi:hypothetical protein
MISGIGGAIDMLPPGVPIGGPYAGGGGYAGGGYAGGGYAGGGAYIDGS